MHFQFLMPMKLVIPTVPQSDAQAPGLKAEAAPEEGTVQRCGLIVPGKKASAAIKKKVNTKRWSDFKQQARRRDKPVTVPLERYMWLVAQPCVYCGAVGSTGVDRVRNSESYTRENSVPCCGPCNMAKRNLGLRGFVQHTRAIAKATRAVGQLEISSSI